MVDLTETEKENHAPGRSRLRVLFGVDEPREKDRPLRLRLRAAILVAGLMMPLIGWGLSKFPWLVERIYTEGAGQWIGRGLAAVSRLAPFSVAELLIVALPVWLVACFVMAIYHVLRGRRRVLNAVAGGLLHVGAVAGVLLLVFYVAWAFNFARADLVSRMGWETYTENGKTEVDPNELARLCDELVTATNAEYERVTGSQDLGKPSALTLPVRDLDKAIDKAYEKVAERFGLHPSFAASRGPAKPVALSVLMCYLATLGFYSPWTGEANYNWKMPDTALPQVVAHEKSHQRGITNEDEANFYGFIACIFSDDPYARYSGYLFAQRQLLSALLKSDHARGEALLKQIYPGVQRDVDAMRAFQMAYQGVASKVGQAVNNTYLKANRVKGGVQAYGRSAELIVVFSRMNGGLMK